MWFLKMSAALVGTAADEDVPLPANVRRYYIASSPHGGGPGGFDVTPLEAPAAPSWGQCALPANPMPYTQTSNALLFAFRNWVMHDTRMPASRYPTLADGTLVAPTKSAMKFPMISDLSPTAPTGLGHPGIEWDFGASFDPTNQTGVVGIQPPDRVQVLRMLVPKVDADRNEVGGVPVVLREVPLGTYLGWNITASGFYKDMICAFQGGMIPFATTKADRLARGDTRLSLEERYSTHDGYVSAVRVAAAKAVAEGFLLQT